MCTLLCLLNSQKCLTIATFDLNVSDHNKEKCTFAIHLVKKTTKPCEHQEPIECYKYCENDVSLRHNESYVSLIISVNVHDN